MKKGVQNILKNNFDYVIKITLNLYHQIKNNTR